MVGIVILNFNGTEDTINCVASVKKHLPDGQYRIAVVDNASKPEQRSKLEVLSKVDDLELIYNADNMGYAAGNNAGIRHLVEQGCTHICILNNDTIVEEDFLTPCVVFLNQHRDVGFVGPVLLNEAGWNVQSTGGDVFIDRGIVTMKNYNADYHALPSVITCDYVGGACILFRTENLQQLGPIPEQYFLFYEETEWCYRAIQKGYRNVILTSTYIRHLGGVSMGQVRGLSRYLLSRNRVVFVHRNASTAKYMMFLLYLTVETVYTKLRLGKKSLISVRGLIDGAFGRVSKRFPFVKVSP